MRRRRRRDTENAKLGETGIVNESYPFLRSPLLPFTLSPGTPSPNLIRVIRFYERALSLWRGLG
jgi:hypothetical protein